MGRYSPGTGAVTVPLTISTVRFHPAYRGCGSNLLRLYSVSQLRGFGKRSFVVQAVTSLPTGCGRRIQLRLKNGKGCGDTLRQVIASLKLSSVMSFRNFVSSGGLYSFCSTSRVFVLYAHRRTSGEGMRKCKLIFTRTRTYKATIVNAHANNVPSTIRRGGNN